VCLPHLGAGEQVVLTGERPLPIYQGQSLDILHCGLLHGNAFSPTVDPCAHDCRPEHVEHVFFTTYLQLEVVVHGSQHPVDGGIGVDNVRCHPVDERIVDHQVDPILLDIFACQVVFLDCGRQLDVAEEGVVWVVLPRSDTRSSQRMTRRAPSGEPRLLSIWVRVSGEWDQVGFSASSAPAQSAECVTGGQVQ
jgi:hypothetical protein